MQIFYEGWGTEVVVFGENVKTSLMQTLKIYALSTEIGIFSALRKGIAFYTLHKATC